MTDKELSNLLKSLKEDIQPEAQWLKGNRDSLFAQISNSGGKELSPWSSFVINFKSILKGVSVPAAVLGSLVLFLGSAMAYSHLLFSDTKPTDSLYIARELSEQVKLNTMRGGKAKDELASQFAASKAQNIVTLLSEEESIDEETRSDLTEKFTKELNTMKEVASRWEDDSSVSVALATETGDVGDGAPVAEVVTEEVFSANLEKGEDGISVSLSEAENVKSASTSPTKIIEQAETLFNEKKYKEAGALLGTLVPVKENEVKTPEVPQIETSTPELELEKASTSEPLP